MVKIYDVIIIGAGASGLLTAARLDLHSRSGLILEATHSPGTKLRMSGAGHCNFTHDGSIKEMLAGYGDQGKKVRKVLYKYNNQAFVEFLESQGIPSHSRDGGRIFPQSENSQEVLDALLELSAENNFALKKNFRVQSIQPLPTSAAQGIDDSADAAQPAAPSLWQLTCENGASFQTRNLVLATGGKSYPSTGSNGRMWEILARDLNLEITPPRPALAPITVENYPYTELSGLSFGNAELSITVPGRKIQRSQGGLLLTHHQFSGPAALNISAEAQVSDTLHINYLPEISREALTDTLHQILNRVKGNPASEMASRLGLPKRFCQGILLRSLGKDMTQDSISSPEGLSPKRIAALLQDDKFRVSTLPDWNKAMATAGGIPLSQMKPTTLEFRDHPGLYAVGEALDVLGITGGYNLQFAFSSASAAAEDLATRIPETTFR